ncbi:unnamed protein product [Leuciscus chuanchicus]
MKEKMKRKGAVKLRKRTNAVLGWQVRLHVRKGAVKLRKRTKRCARLASNAARQERRRGAEEEDERSARLASIAARLKRRHGAEEEDERHVRLASDAAHHANMRDKETLEIRADRQMHDCQRHNLLREEETPQQQEERRARDTTCHQKMRLARLEKARKDKCNLARCDDTDYFQEELHVDYRHMLSKTSLFEYPTCSHCGAYVWKEERKGFCCNSGKINLTYNATNPKPGSIPPQPPDAIKDLFLDQSFVKQAKQYINALAMASIGIKEVAMPGFNPGVRIQGKVYHYIAGPLPEQGRTPLLAQIYFHTPAHELENRRAHASNSDLNEDFLLRTQEAIPMCKPYVQQFKSAIEYVTQNDNANELKIELTARTRRHDLHRGTVNLPSLNSDAAVIAPGVTTTQQFGKLAVTLHLRGGRLQTIDAMHPAYDPLSYVLLLPQGSQGYHTELAGITPTCFYRYHLQVRDIAQHFNLLLCGGRLTQQYVCDMMAKIDQSEIIPGRLTILPPTIYGSPRWYAKEFQDAMALVRIKGKPDFFLTFTCNQNWPEITGSLFEGQQTNQRPDIIARVFHMKVEALLTDLLKHLGTH